MPVKNNSRYGWIAFVSWFVSFIIFSLWVMRGLGHAEILPTDSLTFINNSITRGFVYPLFVDLLVPQLVQQLNPLENQKAYVIVVNIQLVFLALSYGWFTFILLRRHFLAPLVLIGILYFLLYLPPKDPIASDLEFLLSFIMSEGLIYPWLLVLMGLLVVTAESNRTFLRIFLGLWIYIGIEINARLLPFVVLTITPFLAALLEKWKQGTIFKKNSCLPLFTVLFLLTIRCSYNWMKYEAFSPVPYNGVNVMGMALQFGKPGDHLLFRDDDIREFIEKSLADPRRNPTNTTQDFVNIYQWKIAEENYRSVFHEQAEDIAFQNKIYQKVVRTLLYSHQKNRGEWIQWTYAKIKDYFFKFRFDFTIMALVFVALSFIFAIAYKSTIAPLFFTIPLAHTANIFFTVPLQSVVRRYTITSEILVILLWPVLLICMWKIFKPDSKNIII